MNRCPRCVLDTLRPLVQYPSIPFEKGSIIMVDTTKSTAEAKPKRHIRTIEERIAELQLQAEKKAAKQQARAEANRDTAIERIIKLKGQLVAAKADLAEINDILGIVDEPAESDVTEASV